MAGYSGTPLAKKLGIKPGSRLLLVSAPEDFERTLSDLPDSVQVAQGLRSKGPFDVVLAFFRTHKEFASTLSKLRERLDQTGGLWIAWPKKSSGLQTDLGENEVRNAGLASGLVDNKVCAIDETWSGLRLVVRVKDRVSSQHDELGRSPGPGRGRLP